MNNTYHENLIKDLVSKTGLSRSICEECLNRNNFDIEISFNEIYQRIKNGQIESYSNIRMENNKKSGYHSNSNLRGEAKRNIVTVSTKQELKIAKQNKAEEIIVVGKLAKDLKSAKKVTTLGAASLAVLTTAIGVGTVAAPLTGGASLGISAAAAAPLAVSTGMSVQSIILVSIMGLGFIIALFKDYQEIEFDLSKPSLILKRR